MAKLDGCEYFYRWNDSHREASECVVWSGTVWYGMVLLGNQAHTVAFFFHASLTCILGYAIKNDPISGTMNAPPPPSHPSLAAPVLIACCCFVLCLFISFVVCCVVSTDYSAPIHFSLLDRVFRCQEVYVVLYPFHYSTTLLSSWLPCLFCSL